MATRREERCYEKTMSCYFLVRKGRSNDDVGVARGTVFQSYGGELALKPAILLKKSWGGYRRTSPHTTPKLVLLLQRKQGRGLRWRVHHVFFYYYLSI